MARWLTHYIAALLQKAERAQGTKKAAAERECFDAVLALWRHRADFPRHAPLRSFDAAFKTLESLQSSTHLRYFQRTDHKAESEAEQWLKLAEGVDYSARKVISWLIANATKDAAKAEKKWLESDVAAILGDSADLRLARLLTRDVELLAATEEKLKEEHRKDLQEIEARLKSFLELSAEMKRVVGARLDKEEQG